METSSNNQRAQRELSAATKRNRLSKNPKNAQLQQNLQPPKFTANRQYIAPGRSGKAKRWDTDESDASSSKRYTRTSNPFEDYETSETEPSTTVSTRSSIHQTPGTPAESAQPQPAVARDYFKPPTPPERNIHQPNGQASPPRALRRTQRFSQERDGSSSDSGPQTADPDEITQLPPVHQLPQTHQQEAAPTPGEAIQDASEVQRATEKDIKRGKRKITFQKYLATFGLVALNFMFIWSAWYWPGYYYVYLPFVMFPLALNCIMIASILCFKTRNSIRPEPIIEPDHTEDLVYIMPCYNETFEECTNSLDSLVNQVGIEHHKRGIMVVCDGRVRGPGMGKTTADYLLDDIFVDVTKRQKIKKAYRGWNGQLMDVEVSRGTYKGVPYFCIVKEQNQGKRDSLIVVRSFLYKFNIRHTNPNMVFSQGFFNALCNWLIQDVQLDQVDHLIGMDADTIFDKHCISHLLKESKYPNTVGVCGFVAVDFSGGAWNIWRLYQNAEYTIAQGLRRLHQSMATKKVSCLPGCCQLLKICEYTCGDKVLVELFGYHPAPRDGMLKQIRATASEDRNHVCLMLTTHPMAQTRQALRARAYTDVPSSWSVFLSQRRRWTLGATSNDLLLFASRHCQWFERILALCNVLVWCLNIFIVTAIGRMVLAFISLQWWVILAFASVMIIPIVYYIIMAAWLPETWKESIQYLCGLVIFVVLGPFLNILVMLFAVYNMDSFGWGKTRLVVKDDVKEKMGEKTTSDDSSGTNGQQQEGVLTEKPNNNNNNNYDEEANVGVQQPPQSSQVGRPQAAHVPTPSGR